MSGEFDIQMHTMLYVYVYSLNNFLFFINKNMFFSSFLFWDEISNNPIRILTNKKQNRWSEVVCGTVCVIVLWLTSDEWVYIFVTCPKLILVCWLKPNWWAHQGFGTQPNYKAPDKLFVELIILLWQTLGGWGWLWMSEPILVLEKINFYTNISLSLYIKKYQNPKVYDFASWLNKNLNQCISMFL